MIMTAVDTWTIMKSVLMISLKMAISLLHEQRYSFVTMLTLPQVHLVSLCQKLSPSIFSLVTCTGVVIGVLVGDHFSNGDGFYSSLEYCSVLKAQ